MDIKITFPGGKRVDAEVGGYHVQTDQPVDQGGSGTAPGPFDLFLASLAACGGIYVLGFCQARGIPMEGLEVVQHHRFDDAHHLTGVELEIALPASFPEKYRGAVVRAAEGCKVKKLIASPPAISVRASIARGAASGTGAPDATPPA